MQHTAVAVGAVGVYRTERLPRLYLLVCAHIHCAKIGINREVVAMTYNHHGVIPFGLEHCRHFAVAHGAHSGVGCRLYVNAGIVGFHVRERGMFLSAEFPYDSVITCNRHRKPTLQALEVGACLHCSGCGAALCRRSGCAERGGSAATGTCALLRTLHRFGIAPAFLAALILIGLLSVCLGFLSVCLSLAGTFLSLFFSLLGLIGSLAGSFSLSLLAGSGLLLGLFLGILTCIFSILARLFGGQFTLMRLRFGPALRCLGLSGSLSLAGFLGGRRTGSGLCIPAGLLLRFGFAALLFGFAGLFGATGLLGFTCTALLFLTADFPLDYGVKFTVERSRTRPLLTHNLLERCALRTQFIHQRLGLSLFRHKCSPLTAEFVARTGHGST